MRRVLLTFTLLLSAASVWAQGVPLFPAGFQFFDNTTGAPLANGVLYTCQVGSACPGTTQQTWSDVGLTSPNGASVTLSGAGRLPNGLYSNGASYKLVLQNSLGTTEFTQDNIPSYAGYNISALQGTTVPFQAATVLTLASNTITPTRNVHGVDTSGGAQNLNTINTSGVVAPFVLYLYANNPGANPVTVTSAGNVVLAGGSYALNASNTWLALMLRGGTWYELGRSTGTQCGWNITAQTSNYGANLCDLIDVTSGTITITLPAASTCTNTRYAVGVKNDTTNVQTIARAGSDTIDGATSFTTYGVQYESFDFVCNAAKNGWMIR